MLNLRFCWDISLYTLFDLFLNKIFEGGELFQCFYSHRRLWRNSFNLFFSSTGRAFPCYSSLKLSQFSFFLFFLWAIHIYREHCILYLILLPFRTDSWYWTSSILLILFNLYYFSFFLLWQCICLSASLPIV